MLCLSKIGCSQDLPVINASLGEENIYSVEEQKFWENGINNLYKINSADIDYTDLSEIDKAVVDSLEMEVGPMTESVGCSWYCGGGPYKITASSYLDNAGNINYEPDNIHDFNLLTSWVPKGNIGMKINFHFKPFAPRINELTIWNGYLKNHKIWKENARVAEFKLYVNGEPNAILKLEDLTNSQSFPIDPIQSQDSLKDLILTLEILEVYTGTKYKDVAVSELNFDGLDVHCFPAGTNILMANGETKSIEQIQKGELVSSVDLKSGNIIESTVRELVIARHHEIAKLIYLDGFIELTPDHPIWTKDNCWASVDPDKSNKLYNHSNPILKLDVGDKIYLPIKKEYIAIKEIELQIEEQLTYSIELEYGNNFIANEVLVKTEELIKAKQ